MDAAIIKGHLDCVRALMRAVPSEVVSMHGLIVDAPPLPPHRSLLALHGFLQPPALPPSALVGQVIEEPARFTRDDLLCSSCEEGSIQVRRREKACCMGGSHSAVLMDSVLAWSRPTP